jgi:HK97 family phage prohead protease
MTTQEINNLPDSDFAHIEPGGTKDSSGKTVPRDKRHFPLHDAVHVRDALSRAPQSPFGDKAMPAIRKAAKKFGIGDSADGDSDSGGGSSSMSRTLVRPWPLEDIRIVSRADGDGSGRLVEAYATVFDTPVEIRDHQGHYQEIIDRGAFDRTLERIRRGRGGIAGAIRVLYNHGKTMEGMPAPEFQRPIGKPVDIHPDGRGLVTRTEYARTPLAEEILDDIREGRITAQSFEGPDLRSDPALRGPGDRYRKKGGVLPAVRRMSLGLLNYGPALFAANPHAEFLGIVRMSFPGTDDVLDYTEDEESAPAEGGDGTGYLPEDGFPSRPHAHRLWQLRTEELCRQAGISLEEN